MTIRHPDTGRPPCQSAFVFAALGNFTCSVCAPAAMSQAEVEAFARAQLGEPAYQGDWVAIDKSELGMGTPTPNLCNEWPDRQHWFLVDSTVKYQLGTK